jgi:hypothetical protein
MEKVVEAQGDTKGEGFLVAGFERFPPLLRGAEETTCDGLCHMQIMWP